MGGWRWEGVEAAGRETQSGLAKTDVSLLSVFEAGNGRRARWCRVSPASGRLQGWINLRPTARPSRDWLSSEPEGTRGQRKLGRRETKGMRGRSEESKERGRGETERL